jgi:hypothetical protein
MTPYDLVVLRVVFLSDMFTMYKSNSILHYIPVPKSPGDVSWIKLREVCTSEQKLEDVFTFRVAVYRPDDKTRNVSVDRRKPPVLALGTGI